MTLSSNAGHGLVTGDQDLTYPYRIGNLYSAHAFTSADGTNKFTLATGAPGYYIAQCGFQCDETATIAASGMVDIVFSDDQSGAWANFRLYIVQNTTPSNIPMAIRQTNEGPFVWSNKVANSNCQVNLGTALTAGSIRVFIRYGRTAYLG